jgi:L-asparaginase II
MSPFARPERLDPDEVARLHAALVGVLTEARATLAQQVGDEVVIPKASERLFAVHGRAGAACYVCGDTIRSVWMGERETSYCPTCQTGGRILAKVGAEATYGAVDLSTGSGVALKVLDGAPRARAAALLAALRALDWLDDTEWDAVIASATVEIHGGGHTVGVVRPAKLTLATPE